MAVEEKAVGEGEASLHPGQAARELRHGPRPVREPGAMAKPSAHGDPPARWLRRM